MNKHFSRNELTISKINHRLAVRYSGSRAYCYRKCTCLAHALREMCTPVRTTSEHEVYYDLHFVCTMVQFE